jgi:hypothetical protein
VLLNVRSSSVNPGGGRSGTPSFPEPDRLFSEQNDKILHTANTAVTQIPNFLMTFSILRINPQPGRGRNQEMSQDHHSFTPKNRKLSTFNCYKPGTRTGGPLK